MVSDPHRYVEENTEVLTDIIKHSSSKFTRALAIAALVEYGAKPDVEQLLDELKTIRETQGEGDE